MRWLVLLTVLGAAGCSMGASNLNDPGGGGLPGASSDAGTTQCLSQSECPTGWVCNDFGRCERPPPMTDAGVTPVADLPELLQSAQILSLHAPLTEATRNLISSPQLELLPPGAILINTARGPLINEAAVLAALDSGRLGGAGIDVWEREPTPADHPLSRNPGVVATPHMAAYTNEGRRRSHVAAAELVLATLRGEAPTTLVNPTVWTRRRRSP